MAWLTRETGRYRVALGVAVLGSVVDLAWLVSGLGGQDRIQAGANLSTLVVALLATVTCGHAAAVSTDPHAAGLGAAGRRLRVMGRRPGRLAVV